MPASDDVHTLLYQGGTLEQIVPGIDNPESIEELQDTLRTVGAETRADLDHDVSEVDALTLGWLTVGWEAYHVKFQGDLTQFP